VEPERPSGDDRTEEPEPFGWEAGTAEDESPDGGHTALPPKVEAWRRRSAAGAILTGFALGLQQALETKKEDPSIVVQTSGEPPEDLPVEADFEYARPRHSVVNIRPWLLGDTKGPGRERSGDGEPPDRA
jgi:hypothetical protein